MRLSILLQFPLLLFSSTSALPNHGGLSRRHAHLHKSRFADPDTQCTNPSISPFDYSAKERPQPGHCPNFNKLIGRADADEDYSCSESKPCSNKACCSKKTGYCNYGEEACGTNGISPNDVCWSNCDAKAECGRNADPPGKECPLNVCCSEFGFCGMTEDFCSIEGTNGGCQSNCDQPESGASGGDVQKRIIGYYEAFRHDKSCSAMDFRDIPVESLTHLNFAFGYVAPDTFDIVPMDDLPSSLFNEFSDLKRRNRALKATISLGGWTFNDNGTSTQPVFSDMVSTSAKRQTAIEKVISFMREFGFDGVDYDWEYPGASDRGGNPEDGVNFTKFLGELKAAIQEEPNTYEVSFTAPTSYWYMRHFDIKNTVENVDFVNVMSYDLHGVWDGDNPIGKQVLAHTNLTEIKLALDLFWRNSVPAEKLNLGLGFYGRSFQLADPSCHTPGCRFKGGATKGACSGASGILSYKEIMEIIDSRDLTPYYDKENAVKYITWDQDQWVSYDDKDTYQQKIKFANEQGLGGLLIWAIDQDTTKLDALAAVLYPGELKARNRLAEDSDYWKDSTAEDCYVTDCGGQCKAGFLEVEHQPCGGAKPVTRHSKKADSRLCCPVTSVPDSSKCTWRGEAPSCNGHCHDNEVAMQLNRWGDGKYCEDGNKVYCCEVPDAKSNTCYWTDLGTSCNKGDILKTWKGTFLQDLAPVVDWFGLVGHALAEELEGLNIDLLSGYCCPPDEDEKWKNCRWHGEEGSCFDNHCDVTGKQVQLTSSKYGQGVSCAPRLERSRVYCCDPADGASPFLPVPLANLFPDAPDEDTADTDFDLKTDPSYGGGAVEGSDEPDNAAFGFVVMTSPTEIQQSLSKRDGSDWELMGCDDLDQGHEGEHTIRMVCENEDNPVSNCHDIHLGHGVPGTILEMPNGCGPGRYAIAKTFDKSVNQSLPHHLAKRGLSATVYDLKFDYDFRRVPRDLGDTQMRIDYSNEHDYWNSVVKAAPSDHKRKRDLQQHGHKRWLEESWRDDKHLSGMSHEDLHKRWFGEDVVAWIKSLWEVAKDPKYTHSVKDEFPVTLFRNEMGPCMVGGAEVYSSLNIKVNTKVNIETSFGMTIIAKLGTPIDFSSSYVYFRNKGEVTSVFTVDALTTARFSTGDVELFGMENFGANFRVPGIVTVGPNFRLFGLLDGEMSLAGHLESQVKIADWNIEQTYPDASGLDTAGPNAIVNPSYDDTKPLGSPSLNYSVAAEGRLTAHLKPRITFGVDFDDKWDVSSCTIDLTLDGWIRVYASGQVDNAGSEFCWGVDAGAEVYASLDAPSAFGWDISVPRFDLGSVEPRAVVEQSCPIQRRDLGDYMQQNASILPWSGSMEYSNNPSMRIEGREAFRKRASDPGPLLNTKNCLFCPDDSGPTNPSSCPSCPPDDNGNPICPIDVWGDVGCPYTSSLSARSLEELDDETFNHTVFLEKRGNDQKLIKAFGVDLGYSRQFPQCSANNIKVPKWFTFEDDTDCNKFNVAQLSDGNAVRSFGLTSKAKLYERFATEHIYEAQMIGDFFTFLSKLNPPSGKAKNKARAAWTPLDSQWIIDTLTDTYRYTYANAVDGQTEDLFGHMVDQLGSVIDPDGLALCHKGINSKKGVLLGGKVNHLDPGRNPPKTADSRRRVVKDVVGVFYYLAAPGIWGGFTETSRGIEEALHEFDQSYTGAGKPNFKLRQAYCWWIDDFLGSVEENYGAWVDTEVWNKLGDAQLNPALTQADTQWARTNLKGNGGASRSKFKFPRDASGGGIYNAWDNTIGACDGS